MRVRGKNMSPKRSTETHNRWPPTIRPNNRRHVELTEKSLLLLWQPNYIPWNPSKDRHLQWVCWNHYHDKVLYYNPCTTNTTRFFWALVARPFSIFAASFCSVPFFQTCSRRLCKDMALRTHPQVQPFKQHVILSSAARFFDLQENWLENVGNVFPKNMSQNWFFPW